MVSSHPHILAGIVDCAPLADKNVAGLYCLASEFFDTKSFAL